MWGEPGYAFFHHPRALYDLGQEHFSGAKQIADDVHAVHERTFDHIQWLGILLARFFGINIDVIGDAVYQCVFESILYGGATPGLIFYFNFSFGFNCFGKSDELFSGLVVVVVLIEDYFLTEFTQFGFDLVVQRQLSGIDDAHVHPGTDCMVQKHGVHRFTYGFIAAERKREVADAAADAC